MRRHLVWARDKYPNLAAADGDFLEGLVDEAEKNIYPFFLIGVGFLLAVALIALDGLLEFDGTLAILVLPFAYYPAMKLFEPLQDQLIRRSIDSRVAESGRM